MTEIANELGDVRDDEMKNRAHTVEWSKQDDPGSHPSGPSMANKPPTSDSLSGGGSDEHERVERERMSKMEPMPGGQTYTSSSSSLSDSVQILLRLPERG